MRRKRYGEIQIGDCIYLDEDGMVTKTTLFGLVKTERSNQALYRIIDRHQESGSVFIRFTARHVRNGTTRNITVQSRTRTHKQR